MRRNETSAEVSPTSEDLVVQRPTRRLMKESTGINSCTQGIPSLESVLLAIAGHDLRQPLQVLQNTHDILGTGIRTKSELRQLQIGQHAINRMRRQLDQLVTALRLREMGGIKLRPLPLGGLIQKVSDESEFDALKKGIKLRVVRTSASIQSDELLISAILRNLLANAIKYTDPGGHILVGCRQAGDAVRIEVHDSGIGIDLNEMPGLFQAFARMDFSRAGGHGIGLFIVHQAVTILGHRLEIATVPSRGSRFSIVARKANGEQE
jgi:two-component system, OmpR family, phosphate regulon sensor histidine kinase PhoR